MRGLITLCLYFIRLNCYDIIKPETSFEVLVHSFRVSLRNSTNSIDLPANRNAGFVLLIVSLLNLIFTSCPG